MRHLPLLSLLALVLTACSRPPDPLPTLWVAPAFRLTDQTGATLSNDDLQGRVWATDFFFSSCPGICPLLANSMQHVRDAVAKHPRAHDARLVGFSLQPEVDTPEVLAAYGETLGAVPGRWHLLTGPREEIWRLSEAGFKLAVDPAPDNPANPIAHSGKIMLVDRAGMIRGIYDGLDADEVQQLATDMGRLLDG